MSQITSPASSTGTITGSVTANGKGVANVLLWLDPKNTGILDLANPCSLTDASGNFIFPAVVPGPTIVRQIRPPGYSQLTPTNNYGQHVTVLAGASVVANFTDSPPSTSQRYPVTFGFNPGGTFNPNNPANAAKVIAAAKDMGWTGHAIVWQSGPLTSPLDSTAIATATAYKAAGFLCVLVINAANYGFYFPTGSVTQAFFNTVPTGLFDKIHWINECDNPAYVRQTSTVIADYVASLAAAAPIIRQYGAKVILSNPCYGISFVQKCLEAGAGGLVDSIGLHPYPSTGAASATAHSQGAALAIGWNLHYHATECGLHDANWAVEMGNMVLDIRSSPYMAGAEVGYFPVYPTGTNASAGSILDAQGNQTPNYGPVKSAMVA